MAPMFVPETAMNKYNYPPLGQDDIRFARNAFGMQRISKASGMQALADDGFGLGVFRLDAGHHAASRCRIYHVSHT